MPFSAAIFDCDGTLVDSMPMWHRETVDLLKRHGVADPEAVFFESEPLPLHEMCAYLHEHYIPDATGDELASELLSGVRRGYAHDVRMLPGCRAFLDELRAAGIPMVIVSATSRPELQVALEAQDIAGYFEDVISCGGRLRSKEYPDAWEAALKVLGTPARDTWVFEDAPFSTRGARKVGLRTVCLFSPHGDRDEAECRDSCDVFVHGYAELSVALLNDFAPAAPEAASSGVLRALVVAGSPEPSSADLVRRLAAQADYVVAADAGANVLMDAGITPDVFCGDADSAADDAARWARAVAQRDIRFPSEKYATDLSLAIDCARHEAARRSSRLELTLTCATGGRPDHALAVVGQLAHAADASPELVEDAFACRVLSPGGRPLWQLPADSEGRIFSAIAVAEGTVASERGLKWELDHKRLPLLGDEGVSNVVASSAATVECHAGRLAAFLLR
ncbi:thiamine diphosphokinase [Parafannyhessea umbonata]|uniref:thiamine diphosphokinase n=1 Tax=Parafannyhessea umbonata TaxID=604330 RepID=UPI003AB36E19